MNKITPEIVELRKYVELAFGRPVQTTKDFELLTESIFLKTKDRLSPSTHKRLWGYVSDSHKANPTTLNILSRYAGFDSFIDFCDYLKNNSEVESSFFAKTRIKSGEIASNTNIEIGWSPDRYLLTKYLGDNRYEIIESKNSKLLTGDKFSCSEFILGHPMYMSDIERDGETFPSFVAGEKNGLTLLNPIESE